MTCIPNQNKKFPCELIQGILKRERNREKERDREKGLVNAFHVYIDIKRME